MSYTPRFSPDGWLDFTDLDLWTQEVVLDVLDEVATNPTPLNVPPPLGEAARGFTAVTPSGVVDGVLRVVCDHRNRSVDVIGIGVEIT